MKIICVVKFVPDVDNVVHDDENNIISGNNTRMILNPDDACALAFALKIKAADPENHVEVVSMGSTSIRPHMEDLLRLEIDRAVSITDPVFDHRDSFATGEILGKYLVTRPFDCLLTGCSSLDGGSSQVPAHLAETFDLDHMMGVVWVDPHNFDSRRAIFKVADENGLATYEVAMPCALSITRESAYTLPYIKLKDMQRDVSDELIIITNKDLCLSETELGSAGSLTNSVRTYLQTLKTKNRRIVSNDEEGILYVFDFLKQKGFLEK